MTMPYQALEWRKIRMDDQVAAAAMQLHPAAPTGSFISKQNPCPDVNSR